MSHGACHSAKTSLAAMALALWILAAGVAAEDAFGAAATLQSVGVTIGEGTKDQKGCVAIAQLVDVHLAALARFRITEEKGPDHRFALVCRAGVVEGTWSTATRAKRTTTYRLIAQVSRTYDTESDKDYPSSAMLMVQDIFAALPWDGEVAAAVSAPPPEANLDHLSLGIKLPEGWKKMVAVLSSGHANNQSLSPCLAIEIGQIPAGKAPFSPRATGIVLGVGALQSYAEVWLPPDAAKIGRRLLFRFADLSVKDRRLTRAKAVCRKQLKLEGLGTIDSLLSGNFRAALSTEAIELNGINQRVGINYFNFKAANGIHAGGIGAYVHNSVTIGDLFLVDVSLFKDLQAGNYEPIMFGKQFKAAINVAEAYGNLYYLFDPEWYTFAGLGFFYSKINMPYEPPEGFELPEDGETALQDNPTTEPTTEDPTVETNVLEIPTRPKSMSPAAALGITYLGEDVTFATRISFSGSKAGPHSALSTDLDYRLTRTWYAGMNLYLVRFGKTNGGAPEAFMPSIGLHIGFDLRRGKMVK